MGMHAMTAQEANSAVPESGRRKCVSNADMDTLKSAKQLERQRALKQNKQAAHQRAMRRQKEAELCRMREEVEKEKASMLAAAGKELSAIQAQIKSQGRTLRRKRCCGAVKQREEESLAPAEV